MALPFRKRKYTGGYAASPSKKKYKSAKAVYKYKTNKPGGSRTKSKRKWMLKRSRKSKLSGAYMSKGIGGGKDSFNPLGEQTCNIVVNRQPFKGPSRLSTTLASQQLVMKRKRSTQYQCPQGQQYAFTHHIMDNAPYTFGSSETEREIPCMWNIAQGTLINAGINAGATNFIPSEIQMRRQQLYVKSYKCKYTVVNPTNVPMYVSMYLCRYRKDAIFLNQDPKSVWENGLEQDDNIDPVILNSTIGFAPFNSAAAATQPGSKPFQNKMFNKKFGIFAQRHVTLDAGKISNFNVQVKYNKYLGWDECYPSMPEDQTNTGAQGSERTMNYLKDWTVTTMFVFHGARGEGSYISGGITLGTNLVSYAASQLNIFFEEETKFYRMPIRSQSIFLKDDIRTDVNSAFKVVQDEDGDVVDPAFT